MNKAARGLYFSDIKYTADPRYLTNFTFAVFNDSNGLMRMNISGTTKIEVLKFMISFEVNIQNKKTLEFDQPLLKGSVDSCKLQNGVLGNFIVKIMMNRLHKYSNYKFECPQKPGIYHLSNYPLLEDSDKFPLFVEPLLGQSNKGKLKTVLRGKIARTKTPVVFYSGELIASYVA